MPADIRGGPSRTHRLPNQAEAEAAERALQQRVPPPTRRPLPPPKPLPPQFLDAPRQAERLLTEQEGVPESRVGEMLYGQPGEPADPPTETDPPPLTGEFTVRFAEDEVVVTMWAENGRAAYTGSGGSLTEALSVAAGKLEEGLAQPRCPHCGQVLPTEQ